MLVVVAVRNHQTFKLSLKMHKMHKIINKIKIICNNLKQIIIYDNHILYLSILIINEIL